MRTSRYIKSLGYIGFSLILQFIYLYFYCLFSVVVFREISIADQVDHLIKQATSVDNLCNMYEGWTPWIWWSEAVIWCRSVPGVSESNSFSLVNCFIINVDVSSYSLFVASISCNFMLVPYPSQSRTSDKSMGIKAMSFSRTCEHDCINHVLTSWIMDQLASAKKRTP